MNVKILGVLNGWAKLDYTERQEFLKEALRIQNIEEADKRLNEMTEIRKSFNLSPKDSICSCCGR